jgi:peptidoglycan-N-acetylglucosamine deacetylase
MIVRFYFSLTIFLFFIQLSLPQTREVAVTIDDLPTVSLLKDIVSQQQITKDLVDKIKNYNVPAIGFVNEGKLMMKIL